MLCKLVLVTSLAVCVFCPVTSSYNPYNDYATIFCKAYNAEYKVPEVEAAIITFTTCVMKEIGTDAIPRPIEVGVVKKYCAKSPQLKNCARSFFNGVAPCLPPGVVRTSEKIIALIDFFCDNDGARSISLITYGPTCFNKKSPELGTCMNKVQSYIDEVNVNGHGGGAAAGALMVVEKEKCGIVDDGLSCATNALKSCSEKTPAELFQVLHDVLLDSLACTGVSIILQNGVLRLMLAMIFLHLLIGKFNNKC